MSGNETNGGVYFSGNDRGWKWRAALIRLRKDFGHRLVYRPVSGARGYYRSVKMRRNVTRFLRDAE